MQGKEVPVQISIHMNNSAGIFQIQETLGKKIVDSPLENYVEVIAITKPDEPVADQRIVHQLIIKGRRLQASADTKNYQTMSQIL